MNAKPQKKSPPSTSYAEATARPEAEGAQELPAHHGEQLALIGSDAPDAIRRKAYAALVKARRGTPALVNELAAGLSPADPLAARWAVAELYWGMPVAQRDSAVREQLEAVLPADTLAVADRLLNSRWVTRKQEPTAVPSAVPVPRLDLHPLLEVDEGRRWPASPLAPPSDALLFEGRADEALPGLAALDFPLARELTARRGFLTVRQPGCDLDGVERPTLQATVRALESVVSELEKLLQSEFVNPQSVDGLLTLPRLAGRSADLWGRLDRQRVRLVKLGPRDQDRAGIWATVMIAMPSASSGVLSALREIPDAALMALLEQAVANNLAGFIGAIQDIALQRARGGQGTEQFWQRLGEIAPASTKLERWWRNVMAPLAPTGAVTLDERTAADLVMADLQSAPEATLLGSGLWPRVEALPPADRFRGTMRLLGRLQRAVIDARERAFTEVTRDLRAGTRRLATLQSDLTAVFGGVPAVLEKALGQAVVRFEADRDRIEKAASTLSSRENFAVSPRRANDIPDLLKSLLELDRIADEAVQARAMVRIREHMAWAAAEAPHLLEPVVRELHALPPEAVGAVLSVAVSLRTPVLLDGIGSALEQSRAVQVVWRAVLTAHAVEIADELRVTEPLAAASVELLASEVTKAQAMLVDWVSLRPLDDMRAGSAAATAALRAQLEGILGEFSGIVRAF